MSLINDITHTKDVWLHTCGVKIDTIIVPDDEFKAFVKTHNHILFIQGVIVRSRSQLLADVLNKEDLGFVVHLMRKGN